MFQVRDEGNFYLKRHFYWAVILESIRDLHSHCFLMPQESSKVQTFPLTFFLLPACILTNRLSSSSEQK